MDKQVISDYMIEQNREFHKILPDYGTFSSKWEMGIRSIADKYEIETMLDYGAGKQALKKHFPDIQCYDPGILEISSPPNPADLVICTHVLEHVEPDLLDNVLIHLYELTKKVFFISLKDGPSNKFLPDGRDSNLIQKNMFWWEKELRDHFKNFTIVNLDRKKFLKEGKLDLDKEMKIGTFLGVKDA